MVKKAPPAKNEKRNIGAFPRLSLTKTIDLAKAIYAIGEDARVRRLSVFDKLSKAPESGPSRMLVTVANSGYGLITGSYAAEFLQLTKNGLDIVSEESDGYTKYNAIYNALFSNEIFSAFMTRFVNKGVPNDEIALDFLKSNQKLFPQDAALFLSILKENILDFGLVQELSGKKVIISKEMALEQLGKPSSVIEQKASPVEIQTVDESSSSSSELPPSIELFNKNKDLSPQFHFNIQIHLPDSATADTYENIFRSIAKHLLGRNQE